jgi:steroid delta-isomerase-like uncharacterized protein
VERPSDQRGPTGVEFLRSCLDTFNAGDLEACVALLAPDFIAHVAGRPEPEHGPDAWLTNAVAFRDAFPDLHARVDDIFGEGDRVAVRLTFEGTHHGSFFGVEPTGRRVSFASVELYRVAGGRIAEEWVSPDVTTLMGQLTAA